jgi:hypothetical protein
MSEDGVQQPEASSSASKDGAERASDDQTEIPVLVAVHIRPLIHDELMTGCRECLTVADGSSQVCYVAEAHSINFKLQRSYSPRALGQQTMFGSTHISNTH